MTKTLFLMASLSALAAAASMPAEAHDFQFSYKAHELDTRGGREILMRRLYNRVELYCGEHIARSLVKKRNAQACIEAVTQEIVYQIADQRLIAMYEDDISLAQK